VELQQIESLLLDQIASAASHRNAAAVAALSGLAKECELLKTDLASLNRRVEALKSKSALNGSWASSTISQTFTYSAEAPAISRKAAGAQARNEWVAEIQARGIYLHGHGTRYQTVQGQSVAVAFANERPEAENQWFLGLPDAPPDVAVLLCKSREGQRHDIVLPISHLREVWRVLSRSQSGVKFNIRKEASLFLLLVPRNNPLDVTRYVGNYEPLR